MRFLRSFVKKYVNRDVPGIRRSKGSPGGPDFIIIGAQKSGTTSLYHYLCQHPQIRPASKKQVHFFDGGILPGENNFKKGLHWYAQHFSDPVESQGRCITGEATPLYLYDPRVPRRMHSVLPEVKLIAILRNPVERAISHFFHEQKIDKELLSIDEALSCEDERLAADLFNRNFSGEAFRHFSYKKRGEYAEQLQRFYDLFPRENILVVCSEDLFNTPEMLLAEVFTFLDVESDFEVRDLSPRNVSQNRKPVNDSVRVQLEEYFKKKNERLYQLIEKRFHW